MNDAKINAFDLETLAEEVITRPAPDTCAEIEALLSSLPLYSSFINLSPKAEQKRALALLEEKCASPTKEELLYAAEIFSGKYHRIRKDGEWCSFMPKKAEILYRQYYEMTGSPEVKHILDNFDEFSRLCGKSVARRQRADNYAPYRDGTLSTSRDPDSSEWKR